MKLKLFKQKDFSLLIIGKLVSLVGSNIQQFALSLYVLSLTGSATIFASILAISIIPRLIFSPIAGVFGDWFDKKKSIVLLDLLNAVIIASFAVIYFINGNLSILLVYILVILLEITEIFFHSSMSAVLPSIVGKEDMLEANSLNSIVLNIGQLLAPVIAVFVYGVFGLFMVFVINSISFLLSAISECFIRIPKSNKKPTKIGLKSFFTDLNEGIKVIRTNRMISTLIGLGTIINFVIAPLFSIGLIFIIKEILHATDFQFGLFQMFMSASMILAPLICVGYLKNVKIGKISYTSFLAIAFIIILMAIVPAHFMLQLFIPNIIPFYLLLFLTFLIGVAVSIANISIGTLFNQIVPLELMGRTSSVLNLSVTIFIPVGQMIFGFLFDTIAPSYVVALCGVLLIIAVLRYRRALLTVDELEEEKNQQLTEAIDSTIAV